MEYNYNIAKLFEIAFGIKSIGAYKIDKIDEKPTNVNFNYSGLEIVKTTEQASRMSYLGTPIIFPIKFKGKKYQVFNQKGDIELKKYDDFELPAATLVNFRRAKTIIKTPANAAKGTIKEIYGFNDWQIDIRGICLNDPSHANAKTASDQKIRLYEFEKIVDSIQVVSELFNDLDISNLVIEEITINALKGKPSVIPFYLRCSSDEPLELVL